MRIRVATTSDATPIARVHVAAWRVAYRGLIPDSILDGLDVEARAERWREILKPSAGITLVALSEKKVIGFCSVLPSRDENPGANVGEITSVYVHPKHWRNGVGRKLCEQVLRDAVKWRWKAITLWVLSNNVTAIQFYEAMGFVRDGAAKVEWLKEFELREIRFRRSV